MPSLQLKQSEKEGVEIDQGILCNQFLADPECGLPSLPRHAVAARRIG